MAARARERAVTAEAAVAEAGFRLDQLRGELALCTRKRESEREQAAREIAFAQGTARGLASRLAEAEEMRRAVEGRLALADDDVTVARLRVVELERELEETRDQLGQALVRVHGAPDVIHALEERVAAMAKELSEREARIEALLAGRERTVEVEVESRNLARQLEHAERELQTLRDAHQAERLSLEGRANGAERELAQAREELSEVGSLRETIAQHSSELARLRGERDGLRLRLEDAELAIASARTVVRDGSSDAALGEHRQRIEELEAQLASTQAAVDEANTAREKEAMRAGELAHRLMVRDTMIGRLKSEMADFVVTRDDLAQKVRELEKTSTELRESVESARRFAEGQAESERRHARELESRATELERARAREVEQHGETRRTLAEARAILSQLASGFDSDEDRSSEYIASTSELGRQLRRAEARAEELERELERLGSVDSRPERDAEHRRIQQLLSDRDAQLMALEERITVNERDARAMREVFAESRAGLESLLADIANDQRAEAADRIANMLRSLRRY